ncbi:MAG: RNA polymerase sigma factor [Solirubrobacterales bacterium]
MSEFRPRSREQLDELDSDELVAYVRAALAAGDRRAAEDGFAVLVFRHERDVRLRVRAKVPPSDVEDVAQEALFSAISTVLRPGKIESFRAVLSTIVARRIADYTGKRARTLKGRPLAEEHLEAEDIWGDVPKEEAATGEVEVRAVIAQVLESRNEVHRAVIDLYVFEDLTAQKTGERINESFDGHPDLPTPMTNDNVHQIAKRFREDLRALLEDDGG